MTRFEDRLADELGLMAGPEPPVDALAVARFVVTQAPKRRLAPMYTALKFVAAAILLALTGGLLAAGAILLLDDDEQSLDVEAPVSSYLFERATAPTDDPEAFLSGIARADDGTIVVAGLDKVWTSIDDGASWSEQALEAREVIVHDGAFVAFGDSAAYHQGAPYWTKVHTSVDGLDWDLVATLDDVLGKQLLSTPDGLALLGLEFRAAEGYMGNAGYPTVWYSPDAAEWEAREISAPLDAPAEENPNGLSGLARAGDGTWMATGTTAILGEGGASPPGFAMHVFVSDDGIDWSRREAPIPDVGPDQFAIVDHPVWAEQGFLLSVFSTQDMERSGIHLTQDGLDWEHVLVVPGPEMAAMATDGSDVLAVQLPPELIGDPVPPAGEVIHRASDGRTFDDPPPYQLEKGHADAMAFSSDGTVVIAGRDLADCEDAHCIWSPDGGSMPAVWVGTPG